MLTTLAQAHCGPFVALLLTAAFLASVCAGLEDDGAFCWWYDQVRASRRFFVIAGLLGLVSLAQGVDESVAWTLAVVVAFVVDGWMEFRQLTTKRR